MKLSCLTLLLTASVNSFAPTPAFTSSRGAVAPAETTLYISSWGTKGPPSKWSDGTDSKNPVDNIQAYLKAPDAVEARSNLDGLVLVSGLVRSKERTDQFVFDLLNHEESAFEFDKIIAFVDDVKFAKKRLLSRSARYTGLLDKLDFYEASSPGSLPTAEQLEGVKSWVAYLEGSDMLASVKEIASIASQVSSVENVAILLTNAVDTSVQYTLVAVGKLEDHDEGKIPYEYKEFGTDEGILPSDAVFSRDEAVRMLSECLQLECGAGKFLTFSEVYDLNATEAKLIKGLREAGYARPQEIDHMMRDGPAVSPITMPRDNLWNF
jgi:hypothetical protein